MADLPRPVMMMIWSQPAAIASSTPYWMMGLSTSGSISLGWAFVAGRKRVPQPAAGKTALRTRIELRGYGRWDRGSGAAVYHRPLAGPVRRGGRASQRSDGSRRRTRPVDRGWRGGSRPPDERAGDAGRPARTPSWTAGTAGRTPR